MIISHSKKFIFLRTRKTASATIQSYLLKYLNPKTDFATRMTGLGISGMNDDNFTNGPSHVTINHALTQNYPIKKENLKDYFIFCFERNPWRKCISHYHYHKEIAENPGVLWAKNMSFDQYIKQKNFPKDKPLYTLGSQTITNHIAEYENINEEMKYICDKLKIPFTGLERHIHKGKPVKSLDDYYTSETKEIVRSAFQWEIQELGYEYE